MCPYPVLLSLGCEPGGWWAQSSHCDQEKPEAEQLLVAKIVAHPSFLQYSTCTSSCPPKSSLVWLRSTPGVEAGCPVNDRRGCPWKDALHWQWQMVLKTRYLSQTTLFTFSFPSWAVFTWGNIADEDTLFALLPPDLWQKVFAHFQALQAQLCDGSSLQWINKPASAKGGQAEAVVFTPLNTPLNEFPLDRGVEGWLWTGLGMIGLRFQWGFSKGVTINVWLLTCCQPPWNWVMMPAYVEFRGFINLQYECSLNPISASKKWIIKKK